MRLRLASIAVLLFCGVAAHADTVSFTLNNPVQSTTTSGGTLSFNATVSAPASNTGFENLTALQFNINPASMFTVDEDPFLNNYPLTLAPGQTFTGLLFNLFVPSGTLAGPYTGSVVLTGGPSDTQLGTTQAFTVNVSQSVAVTPEPSSLLLLGTGMAGLAMVYRRRFAGASSRSAS